MKSSRLLFRIICLGLIFISILGVFEASAFDFLKDLAKKNTEFLAIVTEIKMIVAGLSSVHIPFISGHTAGIDHSLGKVQNYLLLTDVITFLQIFVVAISKSLIFKIALAVLFVLTFLEKGKRHFSKILIIALALSPGISIYTVAVKHLSQSVHIDFGDQYITELKNSTEKVRKENSALMKEHNQQTTKINNGQKGLILLQKFKEDISYDIKKAENNIKGDYSEIRILIKSAGHSILEKVFRFCTMIIFCLVLLPMGYVLLMRVLMNSLFGNLALEGILTKMPIPELPQIEQAVKKTSFLKKLGNVFKAIRTEFSSIEDKVEHSQAFQKVSNEVKQAEQKVETQISSAYGKAKTKVENKLHHTETVVEDKAKQDVAQVENKVEKTVQSEATQLKTKAVAAETAVEDKAAQLKSEGEAIVSNVETKVSTEASSLEQKGQQITSDVENKVQSEASQVKASAEKLEEQGQGLAADAENKAQAEINTAKEDINKVEGELPKPNDGSRISM